MKNLAPLWSLAVIIGTIIVREFVRQVFEKDWDERGLALIVAGVAGVAILAAGLWLGGSP